MRKPAAIAAGFPFVGKTGFEPATPWSQTRCATGLRYFPIRIGPVMRRKNRDLWRKSLEIPPIVEFEHHGAVADTEGGGEVVVGIYEEEV